MTPWQIWKLRLELWRLSRAYPGDSRFFTVKIRKHRAVRHSASIFVPEFWEYVNHLHPIDSRIEVHGDGVEPNQEIFGVLGLGAVKTTPVVDAYLLARQQALQMIESGRVDYETAKRHRNNVSI
jgi:hypothetical protein